jgi:DNA repair exonuclease SbcCD nuclease subunit
LLLHPLGTVPIVVRFLHTADLQLGMSRRFLTPEAQARFTHARIEVVRGLGRLAAAQDCEFMVVCGDVFEANQLDRQIVARAIEALAEVPVPVLLLPGNHDPLDAASIYTAVPFDGVTVLTQPGIHTVRPGVEVVAAPWTSKRPLHDLLGGVLRSLPPAGAGVTRIAVGHGAVDSLSPDRNNPALVSLAAVEQALADGVVHYVALGDRHSTTAVGSTGRVWYSGAPEATDFDEVDPGNALVVDVSADAVEVTPLHVGRWRFVRRGFSIDGGDDVAVLSGWLADMADKADTVVRVDLTGTVSLAERARLDDALDAARPLFAALDVWEPDGGVVVMPDQADLSELSLSGFARQALDELESAGDDEARDALCLLYRLSRGAA